MWTHGKLKCMDGGLVLCLFSYTRRNNGFFVYKTPDFKKIWRKVVLAYHGTQTCFYCGRNRVALFLVTTNHPQGEALVCSCAACGRSIAKLKLRSDPTKRLFFVRGRIY